MGSLMNQVIVASLRRERDEHDGVPDSESPGERLQGVLIVIFSSTYNDNPMTTVSSAIPTHGNYHNYHGYVS